MTARDRLVIMALALLAVLALGWFMLVAPARKQASEASAAVQTAREALVTAKSQTVSAQSAEHTYPAAYATVVSLGLAVPSGPEVPSLMYELEAASKVKQVVFNSISTGGSGTPAAASAASGFSTLPFTFQFEGTFSDLDHLLDELEGFAVPTASGVPRVTGRLLTIQSLDIAPAGPNTGPQGEMTGTVTASAYTLAGTTVTAGATPAGPASTPAGSSESSSPGTGVAGTPAVIGGL